MGIHDPRYRTRARAEVEAIPSKDCISRRTSVASQDVYANGGIVPANRSVFVPLGAPPIAVLNESNVFTEDHESLLSSHAADSITCLECACQRTPRTSLAIAKECLQTTFHGPLSLRDSHRLLQSFDDDKYLIPQARWLSAQLCYHFPGTFQEF